MDTGSTKRVVVVVVVSRRRRRLVVCAWCSEGQVGGGDGSRSHGGEMNGFLMISIRIFIYVYIDKTSFGNRLFFL